MIEVGILGASGYGGGELLRWLSIHPEANIKIATSKTYADMPVYKSFGGFAGRANLYFKADADPKDFAGCDVVFLARDNGVAMGIAADILEQGCKVIDLSADFRFRDVRVYESWYKMAHKSSGLSQAAVYGMPELYKNAIRNASLVGNPGCYTTTSILALAPLLALRDSSNSKQMTARPLIDINSIIIDGKSGVSGAGRSKFGLDYHYSEINESATAYKIAGTHRHTPEIEQELSALSGENIIVTFTPHLVPMTRGILATSYAALKEFISADDLRSIYRSFYHEEPFVFISDGIPATKHTTGSNMIHIGLDVDARTNRVTVVSVTDNLGKGMAGQAIQNMNLMFGMKETTGLEMPGMWP